MTPPVVWDVQPETAKTSGIVVHCCMESGAALATWGQEYQFAYRCTEYTDFPDKQARCRLRCIASCVAVLRWYLGADPVLFRMRPQLTIVGLEATAKLQETGIYREMRRMIFRWPATVYLFAKNDYENMPHCAEPVYQAGALCVELADRDSHSENLFPVRKFEKSPFSLRQVTGCVTRLEMQQKIQDALKPLVDEWRKSQLQGQPPQDANGPAPMEVDQEGAQA